MRSGIRRWSNRASRWLISLLLLAALLYCVAETARLVMRGPVPPSATWGQRLSPPSTSRPTGLSETDIRSWQLFGAYATTNQGPGSGAEAIPASPLKWTLLGVFRGPTPLLGWAIIRTDDGPDQAYRVGDHIESDVSVAAVGVDSAIIVRDGHKEKLLLPSWSDLSMLKPAKQAKHKKVVAQSAQQATDGDAQAEQSEGFKITTGNSGVARKLGLREGDVLLSINGYQMNSMDDMVLALKSMKDASQSNILLKRNGKEIRRTYRSR